MASLADAPTRVRTGIYVPVSVKFSIAVAAALAWVMLSIFLSRPWMASLAEVTHPLFALVAITFIAYVPVVTGNIKSVGRSIPQIYSVWAFVKGLFFRSQQNKKKTQ